ncbi:hypothetical protein GJU89_02215 [Brucella sp. 09RB8918]|nr:hypothetical protein [Brucella sp. 09RB8913]MRN57820.1 hypothetical protein [Brucella sp. 09RB8918]MRN77854.1 hypothetical protein [Brucella sp. 10RB9210]
MGRLLVLAQKGPGIRPYDWGNRCRKSCPGCQECTVRPYGFDREQCERAPFGEIGPILLMRLMLMFDNFRNFQMKAHRAKWAPAPLPALISEPNFTLRVKSIILSE